jgi:hypothetical protein
MDVITKAKRTGNGEQTCRAPRPIESLPTSSFRKAVMAESGEPPLKELSEPFPVMDHDVV